MTTSKSSERARRIEVVGETPRAAIAAALRARARELGVRDRAAWPNPAWQKNPVGFFRTILGFDPWKRQLDIVELAKEAIATNKRVAVASGHKIGKSTICAAIALWAYCSFPGVRVVLTAATARQVDGIIWREVRMMLARHGRCVACKKRDPVGPRPCPHAQLIEEQPGDLARTGLKAPDFREIVGFTAKEAEAVAGVSGPFLVYIVDEASGVPQIIYEAIEGNRAGGALVILIGNPTKLSGEFFDAFHAKKDRFYLTDRVSSEETPNVVAGRIVIPGLATRAWVAEKRLEWGERSPLYLVRVRGEHPVSEKGAVFPLDVLAASAERWDEIAAAGNVLCIGVDVAGSSGVGDESAFAVRRGNKIIDLRARTGLTPDAHLAEILGLIAKHRERGDEVRVIVDREGEPGAKAWGVILSYLAQKENDGAFVAVGVRASERAQRDPRTFDRVRDELVAALADWLRDGGAIPEEGKLQAELHAMRWVEHISGRQKLIGKDKLREALGRSPDRADAVALSVWGETQHRFVVEEHRAESAPQTAEPDEPAAALDPYAGLDAWRG